MQPVTIYTTPFCGYCAAAKRLLNKKGIQYDEIDVSGNPQLRQEMMTKANGGYTVPQIFVGSTHVGGFDEMSDLEMDGKLDPLLRAS